MADLAPPPYPCGMSRHICPYTLRCAKIDDAALLAASADGFAAAAAGEDLSGEQLLSLQKPGRAWRERGGCPAYQGLLNAGSRAAVQCGLVSIPLHDYVGVKFCESGRRIYCPNWNEKGAAENQVADTPPEEGET